MKKAKLTTILVSSVAAILIAALYLTSEGKTFKDVKNTIENQKDVDITQKVNKLLLSKKENYLPNLLELAFTFGTTTTHRASIVNEIASNPNIYLDYDKLIYTLRNSEDYTSDLIYILNKRVATDANIIIDSFINNHIECIKDDVSSLKILNDNMKQIDFSIVSNINKIAVLNDYVSLYLDKLTFQEEIQMYEAEEKDLHMSLTNLEKEIAELKSEISTSTESYNNALEIYERMHQVTVNGSVIKNLGKKTTQFGEATAYEVAAVKDNAITADKFYLYTYTDIALNDKFTMSVMNAKTQLPTNALKEYHEVCSITEEKFNQLKIDLDKDMTNINNLNIKLTSLQNDLISIKDKPSNIQRFIINAYNNLSEVEKKLENFKS